MVPGADTEGNSKPTTVGTTRTGNGRDSVGTYGRKKPCRPIGIRYPFITYKLSQCLMNKEQFSKLLIEQHNKGMVLLSLISSMHESKNDFGDGYAMFGGEDLYYVPEDELNSFLNKFEGWKSYVFELLKSQFGRDDQFVYDWDSNIGTYISKKEPILPQLKKKVNKGLSLIDSFLERLDIHFHGGICVDEKIEKENMMKPPKIFISHKKEDKAYADALVNLINFIIGADGDKIFCSSVQGYGIKQSRDIMDELKAQFDNYDIFMVIIHSPRYYQSPVCLNEMGAAWVLGTRFSSFLTMDCKPEQMRGVINKEKIYIDPKDDPDQLNGHLNDFKNDLVELLGCNQPDENKWENARSRFIKEVSALTYPLEYKVNTDLFEHWYIPAFQHIFELLDLENYQRWTYPCALGGNTVLRAYIYENLDQVPNYILSRPKHKEYASIDSLMRNLGLLVNDFSAVYSQHAEKFGEDAYVVERFYKRIQNNPNYERDLEAYNEHVLLVSDLLFELTRLCNLILSKIREIFPNYRQDIGLLHIDMRITTPDLVYSDAEISDSPYPGIKDFIKVRLTRETHLGLNPNIDESGYEN